MPLYANEDLYKSLTDLQVIPEKTLDELYKRSKAQEVALGDLLVEKDLIADKNLGQVIAEITSFPFVNLSQTSIPRDVLHLLPETFAKKQRLIAFHKDESLHIASSNPKNISAINAIKKKARQPLKLYYATTKDIQEALSLYLKDVQTTFQDVIEQASKQAQSGKAELPIIKIVDTIVMFAYNSKASDIHIEPEEHYSLVRFRIDGIMHDIIKLPIQIHAQIVTRIKVLSELRTDEHHAAQDGRFQYITDEEQLDIRVSIAPVTNGENIVMRLLSERSRQFSLSDLGFSDTNMEFVKRAYSKPHGMILTTGPTGSGKTTTMYAMLKILNKRDVNIMTIEDPVEYNIDGVSQIQVNARTNLTFADGLRSIVRQDPDIILVGEIRDEETAKIAINAAMTGHLVLSTLHTNDAATAIPRLMDMGVEPFLIASSVNLILAQRLIRKIDPEYRISKEISLEDETEGHIIRSSFSEKLVAKHFGTKGKTRIYYPKVPPNYPSHHSGYSGRNGIFEVLEINDDIRKAIVDQESADTIKKIALEQGMKTMMEDGIEKIKLGITTVEEVLRVTKE